MPGQPAWTLTEMLECNLPLCWAGGGDCNVGLAQSLVAYFFSLKPIRAIGFIIKNQRSRAVGFWLEQFFPTEKRVKPCVVRSSFSAALLQQEKMAAR